MILLCSLPPSYSTFRDTILYSRESLTVDEVYDSLTSYDKMKHLVVKIDSRSNLRVDQSLQTEIKLVTFARRKGTLNLSAISYKIRLKGRLRIKRENNQKIPVKLML